MKITLKMLIYTKGKFLWTRYTFWGTVIETHPERQLPKYWLLLLSLSLPFWMLMINVKSASIFFEATIACENTNLLLQSKRIFFLSFIFFFFFCLFGYLWSNILNTSSGNNKEFFSLFILFEDAINLSKGDLYNVECKFLLYRDDKYILVW